MLREGRRLQPHQGHGAAGRLQSGPAAERLPNATRCRLLARGSALRFFLTRLYDWLTTPEGALVAKKDPLEYLRKLRFHRQIDQSARTNTGCARA